MEAFAHWVATYPLFVWLAVSAAAGGSAVWLGRYYEAQPARARVRRCLGMAAGAGVVFLLLALAVGLDRGVVAIDTRLAAALGLSMPSSLLWVLSWFTRLGDRDWLTIVAVAMTVWLLWRREWRLALACAISTGGAGMLSQIVKQAFQRVRPEHVHGYVSETGWSFASGHASASFAVYGFACYLALRILRAPWREACLAGTAALIASIGASRILLQVHYLSDVVAGFALSLAWLSLCVAVLEHQRIGVRRV